jgi:hypothetical protein
MELVHYDLNTVSINGNEYSFSHFKKLEPNYSAPFGFPVRVYRKGMEHYTTDGANRINLSTNDPEMDRICNREGELARLILTLQEEDANPPNGDFSVVHKRNRVLKQKKPNIQSPK